MLGMATGRYSIIRGVETTNDFGDAVESETVHSSGILGSIIEQTKTDYNANGTRIGTYRELTGRFGADTDVKDSDRIRDEKTGEVFVVSGVRRSSSMLGKAEVVVDLTIT